MPSRTVALVPFRSPGRGKTRLAPTIAPPDRAELASAMLADVLAALLDASLDEVVVVAGGTTATRTGTALGVTVVTDPIGTVSLDGALDAAGSRFGDADLLVVAADLPLLTTEQVRAVTDRDADVVVAATHDGGTGGLLRRPGDVIPTAYGDGSARRHRALAIDVGARVASVDLSGFRHDVDTIDDLRALAAVPHGLGPATARLLPGLLEPSRPARH